MQIVIIDTICMEIQNNFQYVVCWKKIFNMLNVKVTRHRW